MKEKMEKIKVWMKENWMYVVGGTATLSVIVLAVWKGSKTDISVVKPFVIDKSKDEWMDQLNVKAKFNGQPLTVREMEAIAVFDEWHRSLMKEEGFLSDKIDADITDKIEANPDSAYIISVLDGIEGFWSELEPSEEKSEGS